MTTSGERSALDPDLVPVHHRIRRLLELHPVGLLPAEEVKAIRDSIPRTSRSDREPRAGQEASPQSREEAERQFNARKAAMTAVLRSAAACTDADLDRLSRDLRTDASNLLRPHLAEASELDLPLEQVRVMARHLLHRGVSSKEIDVGLRLMITTAEQQDANLIREIALLGRNFAYLASQALGRLTGSAPHLYWIAVRVPHSYREPPLDRLAATPDKEREALLASLPLRQAAELVRMFAELTDTPLWFHGQRQFADVLLRAAKAPRALGEDLGALSLIAQLWDDVRYSRSALLGFGLGEREAAVAGFREALADPAARNAVDRALEADPRNSDLVWLRRQVDQAAGCDDKVLPPGIAIRFTVPAPSSSSEVRTHILVDGQPLVERHFDRGFGDAPEQLLQRGAGLNTETASRNVRLAEGFCVEECCGALRADISRDDGAGAVEWIVRDTGRPRRDPARLSFDAPAYDAEVARATADDSWEWPARRAARLLNDRIVDEPELLARWNCRLWWITSRAWERTKLQVVFQYPIRKSEDWTQPWLQFNHVTEVPDTVAVDEHAVSTIVERVVSDFREGDPKLVSRICGGTREHAEALGFSWPSELR
jgi:hypothetical protein